MRNIALLVAILSFAAFPALAQSASTTGTQSAAPAEPRVELAAFPQPGKLTYAVIRDGNKIGSQVVEFQRNGDQLLVLTSVKIEVSLLGITIYRFVHRSEEEWKGGELARLTSNTDDDGDKRVVDLKLVDGKLKGQYNGQAKEFPAGMIPATFWHPASMRQTTLLDQVKARNRQITVKDLGLETITARGKKIEAHHYSVSGQIKREIWYGPDGRLEKLQFEGKDGSDVIMVLS
ncbi:MAG TPA: DUF6134 family protein [Verrucomicrobiae bacterium]|nr:DUF6134 family protein [Verrucomicrobiae bacterium]